MNDLLLVFSAGLGGVFASMVLLYIAIRITSVVADRLSRGGSNDK